LPGAGALSQYRACKPPESLEKVLNQDDSPGD
jgi:hypothetical protein